MKFIKILLILSIAFILLACLTVVFILSSSGLQTAVVKRALPDEISLDKAHLSTRGLTVEGVRGEVDGAKLHMERLRLDFSLMRTLTRQHLHLREFSLTGLVLDLTDFTPGEEPEEKPARGPIEFPGLFPEAEWGAFSMDRLLIEAEAILPGGAQRVSLRVSGEDFSPKKEPLLQVSLTFADETLHAVVPSARVESELRLAIRDQRAVNGLVLALLTEVDLQREGEAQTLTARTDLRLEEKADRTGETYTLGITLFPETPEETLFLRWATAYTYAEKAFAGEWAIQADTRTFGELTASLLEETWAAVRGEGSFAFREGSNEGSFQGTLRAEVQDLHHLLPELESMPNALLETRFDFHADASVAEVRALQLLLAAPLEQPLLEVVARQPFGIRWETMEPFFGETSDPLLEIHFNALPLDTINALTPDLELALASFGGRIHLFGDGNALQLRTVEPLTLQALGLTVLDEPVLENLTLALAPSLSYTPESISFDLGELILTRSDTVLSLLEARGTVRDWNADPVVDFSAESHVVIEEWLQQPAARSFHSFLETGRLNAEIKAQGPVSQLAVEINPALELTGLNFAVEDEVLVENLHLTLAPTLKATPDSAEWELGEIVLRHLDTPLLRLTGQGSAQELTGDLSFASTLQWSADLPALLQQPAARPFNNLREGQMEGQLEANGSPERIRATVRLALQDLLLKEPAERINSLSLDAQLNLRDQEILALQAPLKITINGAETDFLLALEAVLREESPEFQIEGRARRIDAEHLMLLAAAFQNPEVQAPAAEPASTEPTEPNREPDAAPVWAGLLASLNVSIDEILLPGAFNLHELTLRANVNDSAATLNTFRVKVGEAWADARGTLSFRSEMPAKPYLLEAALNFHDFDLGAFLRSAQPDVEPALEAMVNMEGKAGGESPNLEVLAEAITGTFTFSARQGTLRALRRGAVASGAQVAGVATRLGGLLSDRGEVEAVGQLVTYFNAVRFDRLEVDVERDPNFDLILKNFSLANADLRLEGNGRITHVEGKAITEKPLRMELRLAAAPPLSHLFDSLSLLGEVPDETGFRSLNQPLVIQGNAAEPDARPLWILVADAAARAAARQIAPRREAEKSEEQPPEERRSPRIPRIPNF